MIPKPLKSIREGDLQLVVSKAVPAGKTIEYKRELPQTSPEEQEVLADVSSLANTLGGDLVFGVDHVEGTPSAVVGLTSTDADREIRRLNELLNSGLEPKIRYDIQPVMLHDAKLVLIVRAERSWLGPHRVIFKSHDKFYGRTTKGKHSLDVSELRTAFGFSQTIVSRIRSFRTDRITALARNETPVPFTQGAKLVLHCVPFESFGGPRDLDFAHLESQAYRVSVMNGAAQNHRSTFEGFVTFTGRTTADSYTQVFRSGIIEAVDGTALNDVGQGKSQMPALSYEQRVLEYLAKCFQILRELGIMPPIAVALTLVNVQGLHMSFGRHDFGTFHPINRNHVIPPEVVVNNFDEAPSRILRPLFGLVWNAYGYPESRSFNPEGDTVQAR
jgi:Putative DNA-binding domain